MVPDRPDRRTELIGQRRVGNGVVDVLGDEDHAVAAGLDRAIEAAEIIEERADILRAAWRKAEAHLGRKVAAEEFVVIGDTPRDVAAAHEVGMACVGVATGRFTVSELMDHGAEDALPDLCGADVVERIARTRRRIG